LPPIANGEINRIPTDIIKLIRRILLQCEEFSSQNSLVKFFNTDVLKLYSEDIPKGYTNGQRVDYILKYLSKINPSAINLMLSVLSDKYSENDKRHKILSRIVKKLEHLQNITSLKQQLIKYKQNLITVEEKLASFIDPRSIPPDLEENYGLIQSRIKKTEEKLELLEKEITTLDQELKKEIKTPDKELEQEKFQVQ
jgi:hypothetical protein